MSAWTDFPSDFPKREESFLSEHGYIIPIIIFVIGAILMLTCFCISLYFWRRQISRNGRVLILHPNMGPRIPQDHTVVINGTRSTVVYGHLPAGNNGNLVTNNPGNLPTVPNVDYTSPPPPYVATDNVGNPENRNYLPEELRDLPPHMYCYRDYAAEFKAMGINPK